MNDKAPRLAAAFAALLRRDLTPEQWATMRVENMTITAGCCASHNYLDANMTMAEAAESLGIATVLDCDDGTPEHDAACEVWNAAWDIAKRDYLTETATLDDLTQELESFYAREGLESACAMESLMGATLTQGQREWLTAFVLRWEALQDAADLAETVRAHSA